MDKKEIEQASKTLGLVSRHPTNMDYSDGYYRGVKDAARAIDERMKEDVVLEEPAYVYLDYGRPQSRIVLWRIPGTGDDAAETIRVPRHIVKQTGQRVTVTVKEEKDDKPSLR